MARSLLLCLFGCFLHSSPRGRGGVWRGLCLFVFKFGLCFSCACFLSVLKFVSVLICVLNVLCVCFVFKFSCVFFFLHLLPFCFLEFVSVFVLDCVLCLLFVRCFQCVRKKSKDLRAVATFLRSLMLAVDIDKASYQCCFEDRRTPAVLRLKNRV